MRFSDRKIIRPEAEVMDEIKRSIAEAPEGHSVAWVFDEVQRLMEYAYGPVESEPSTGR